jgi:uncharacterized protein (TIGR02246 family)
VKKEVIELERRFWLEASPDLYRERMADDGLMVFPGPGVLDKEATLAAVERAGPWQDVAMDDVRVVPLADDAAALVYRATGRRQGEPPYTALVTSVHVRRDDRWQIVLHQQSPPP